MILSRSGQFTLSSSSSVRQHNGGRTAVVALVALALACGGAEGDGADGLPDFTSQFPEGSLPGSNSPAAVAGQTQGAPAVGAMPGSPMATNAPTGSAEGPGTNVAIDNGQAQGQSGAAQAGGAGGAGPGPAEPSPGVMVEGAGGDSMGGAGDGDMLGAGGAGMLPADQTATDDTQPGDGQPDTAPPDDANNPPPVVADINCPADATFCSGFEGAGLPDGAAWEPAYEPFPLGSRVNLDTAVVRSGNQAISVASNGGYSYNMLTVPVPGQAFWTRMYIQFSSVFGDNSHDTPFMASVLPVGEYNQDEAAEFSEQGNQVLLNRRDALFSANGAGFPQGAGPTLPANTWICMEAFFDGGSGDVQIFSDGQPLLSASNFATGNFQTFRFGYLSFNDARTVWYDDVVVAASRVGCN